jgi:hypothetical protein
VSENVLVSRAERDMDKQNVECASDFAQQTGHTAKRAEWKQTFFAVVSGSMMPPAVLVGARSFSTSTRFNSGITFLVVDMLLVLQP